LTIISSRGGFWRHGLPPLNAVTSPISGAGRSAPPFAVTPAKQVVAVQETSTHANKCDANNPLVVSKTNSKLAVALGEADQITQWAHSRRVHCKKLSSRQKRADIVRSPHRSVRESSKSRRF
jgi:hypothetical protein